MPRNPAARRCTADRVTGGRCWAWAMRGAVFCAAHRRSAEPAPAEPAAQPVSADIGTRPTAPTADAAELPPFWRELI